MKNKKINCINIAYVFKTSAGSINGSWTEGNVSTVKKITLPDGSLLPYVSGQSLKYQIKKGWKELGLEEMLSEVKMAEKIKGVDMTEGNPIKFIDDDLFGYMIASQAENRRRTAAIRVSPAIGIFPYRGDRDLGTKSKEQTGGDMSAGGNIFETEMYYNYFRTNFLIEYDRIGTFQEFELGKELKGKVGNIDDKEKKQRVIYFLHSLSNIWGGGKQSRFLTDMAPKFLVITFQTAKNPIFLEGINVSENEELDTKTIKQILQDNNAIIAKQIIGVRSGIFKNDFENEIGNVVSIQAAFEQAIKYIDELI